MGREEGSEGHAVSGEKERLVLGEKEEEGGQVLIRDARVRPECWQGGFRRGTWGAGEMWGDGV